MSKINLLPWREELRKIRNLNFYITLGLVIIGSLFLLAASSFWVEYQTEVQDANSEYITNELSNVKSEMNEIQRLQENKEELLERLEIIRSLQVDRLSIVKLLDLIPRVLPESLYLERVARTEIKAPVASDTSEEKTSPQAKKTDSIKKQYQVQVEGVGLTNSSISAFLKKLQEVPQFSDIKLNEISINKEKSGFDFKMEWIQHIGGKE